MTTFDQRFHWKQPRTKPQIDADYGSLSAGPNPNLCLSLSICGCFLQVNLLLTVRFAPVALRA